MSDEAKSRWNVGDVMHLLEVAVILISIGMNYQRFQQIAADVERHSSSLDRIEHYLGSQDRDYWRKARQNGDSHP